jgi:hypothetical protein
VKDNPGYTVLLYLNFSYGMEACNLEFHSFYGRQGVYKLSEIAGKIVCVCIYVAFFWVEILGFSSNS